MEHYIKGNFKKAIFKSEKGYMIGLFRVKDTNDTRMDEYKNKTITFTGTFPNLNEEETYLFFGEPLKHPRYGFQYNVLEFERVKPEDKDGVIEFLSSDLFPGVGEKLASKIVEKLGVNALELIMEDITVLSNIPKLTPKKCAIIYENLLKYEESHAIIIYLTELGFTIKDCMSIYNQYKSHTKDVITNNIYKIVEDIEEIYFQRVDEVALKNGIKKDDENRLKSVIIFIMNKLVNTDGDTYLNTIKIRKNIEKFLQFDISTNLYDDLMFKLTEENKIVKYEDNYYLKDIFEAEDYVAKRILSLNDIVINKNDKIFNYLEHLEKTSGILYNDKQKEAIIKSLENNILIITGGPGTGKTTIIKAIVELYSQLNNLKYEKLIEDISLLAPTGRAAKRMSESTSLPASTIHRFLKWNKDLNKFAVNEYEKDQSKLVIIDESSMIDIKLLDSLFRGLEKNCKIIMVGDANQLPSVGPGNVLKDLIESEVIDTIFLDYLYRQDENSYINTLAQEIKNNSLSEEFLKQKSDYIFLPCNGSSLKDNIKENIRKILLNKKYDYKKLQIMAPMYHGENGIDNLNNELQDVFNPPSRLKKELRIGDITYREGDKILQLVNQPDDNIFNGDIGIIKEIKDKEMDIDFDNNLVTITSANYNRIKHAFVISIHKSQGSEFEMVVLPICSSYRRMLYRKLLYTAVTRAKKKLVIIGEPPAFQGCVLNNNEYIRNTSLIYKIQNLLYKK